MASQNGPLHPSFVQLYEVGDVLSVIVQWLPWPVVHVMAFWPVPGLLVARKELRRRMFNALSPFIHRKIAPMFFRELEDCQGVITGSVA
jgi:hypothetical protein